MATLAAPIATEFKSLSLLAWLATGFLVGQAATQPLSGKLTDIFSRQLGLVVSNCLFAMGNIICGLAQDNSTMIVGRVVAGVGGGCLNTIATIIASDLIPLRQRGLWQGIGNVFWGLGNGLGGLFGGYMNDFWNWRIAFLAQTPLTIASLVIIGCQFTTIGSSTPRIIDKSRSSLSRVDFLGSSLLISSLVLFLLGLTSGGNLVPWSHPLVWISLPLSLVCFCTFIYVEQNVAREPILPLHFLRDRTILCACLTNWTFHMGLYIIIFYIPIYYRTLGVSTTRAGEALIPLGVFLPLGSLTAGIITSSTGRYKNVLTGALLLNLAGAVGSAMNTLATPLWLPMVYIGLMAFAMGAMLVVTLVAFTSAVEIFEQALVTSLSYVFRATGSVMGTAIGSAVYQSVLGHDLWARLGNMDEAADIINSVKDSLDAVEQLPDQLQMVVRTSYMQALKATFSTTVGFAVLAVFSGLLVKQLKLHSTLMRNEEDNVVKGPQRDTSGD